MKARALARTDIHCANVMGFVMSCSNSEILPHLCEFLTWQAVKFMYFNKDTDGVTYTIICGCFSEEICYHRLCFKICTDRNETVQHSLFQAVSVVFNHWQLLLSQLSLWQNKTSRISNCRSVQAGAASFILSSARDSRRRRRSRRKRWLRLSVRKLCADSSDSYFDCFVFRVCAKSSHDLLNCQTFWKSTRRAYFPRKWLRFAGGRLRVPDLFPYSHPSIF